MSTENLQQGAYNIKWLFERVDKLENELHSINIKLNMKITESGEEIKKRNMLIKFVTWVRNHYAVNAVIDNKGMVDFYLGQEKL